VYFEKRTPLFLELGFASAALPKLKSYVDLLWSANEDLNLVSRKMTFEELIDNHVIDCLLPLSRFPSSLNTIADFGSGGGLPAVIYAIQFPQTKFQLFEKSPKKQEFLARCSAVAPNIEVHGEIPKTLQGIDLITARGFKPLDVILDVSRSYYASGGRYFLLKARREKIEEELSLAMKKFKDLKCTIEKLRSPVLENERHLVLLEKKHSV
jgi:16S rRNA (guanine527-N7)-methyltransferase